MSLSDDLLAGLSAETLKALKEFATSSGIALDEDEPTGNILQSVQHHFRPPSERETVFDICYESSSICRERRRIEFRLKGVKKELGQTLDSTGLTIWRAAEHLCQYIIDHPERFEGKSVCELGAGLGLVSILLDKMHICSSLVATDGDDTTLELLVENKIECDCDFATAYLLWGEHEDFASDHPQGFDIVIAADVIYEEEQVQPLIASVARLMREDGEFLLAFARRNVPIDRVFVAAEAAGLVWTIVDKEQENEIEADRSSRTVDDRQEGGTGGQQDDLRRLEPIYRFSWRK